MTRFVQTRDGYRIAYSCSGKGSGLVLLHGGFIQNRSIWTELSYVSKLQQQYTVVTIDLRGHGESSKPIIEQAYSIEQLIQDINLVTEAVGLKKFFLWGFSLGASIALHAAVRQKLYGVVATGSFFGQELIDYGKQNISSLEAAVQAKAENRLDRLKLSSEERFFVENADLDIALAISRAMAKWLKIEPDMIKSPLFLYAGTNDESIYSILKKQSNNIWNAEIRLNFFEGLDHFQAISEKKIVLPIIEKFLLNCQTYSGLQVYQGQ